jgi:signal transduction histidine kinase
MFTLDPKTLSILMGMSNLVFAALASLYIVGATSYNRALDFWRWAKVLAGAGFLLNLVQATGLPQMPVWLGNSAQMLAFALELSAYCLLLERQGWQRPLVGCVSIVLLMYQAATWWGSENLRLVIFSLSTGLMYATMAALLLRARGTELLARVIGLMAAAVALVLTTRAIKGLFFESLVRFDNDALTSVLYLVTFVVVLVNGFGFLLLAKQLDDRQLKAAFDQLTQAELEQRKLLSMASHEFRTPAAAIKASLDSLRLLQGQIHPEVAKRLHNIGQASLRLTELANTLISQDRLIAHTLQAQRETINLNALVAATLALYPAEHGLQCQLPETVLTLQADPTLLRIALHNLIDNALAHHRPERGPVVVTLTQDASHATLSVADQGPGIADANKQAIFLRFHNLRDKLTHGLGLSIVQAIAKAHQGSVRATDNMPHGTVFSLQLPL